MIAVVVVLSTHLGTTGYLPVSLDSFTEQQDNFNLPSTFRVISFCPTVPGENMPHLKHFKNIKRHLRCMTSALDVNYMSMESPCACDVCTEEADTDCLMRQERWGFGSHGGSVTLPRAGV